MIYYTILNIVLIGYGIYKEIKRIKEVKRLTELDLKYQRHLRNVFDYQIQMYAFMDAKDAEGFKIAADAVSEELNKCEEILKSR